MHACGFSEDMEKGNVDSEDQFKENMKEKAQTLQGLEKLFRTALWRIERSTARASLTSEEEKLGLVLKTILATVACCKLFTEPALMGNQQTLQIIKSCITLEIPLTKPFGDLNLTARLADLSQFGKYTEMCDIVCDGSTEVQKYCLGL